MSKILFYDSDDERDSFDVERRQIEKFQRNFLSTSFESSTDDEESFIDGTKILSSTKFKKRANHFVFHQQENSFQTIPKIKIPKPTKSMILETERKTQQFTRAEELILPKFIPKPLNTFKSLEKPKDHRCQNSSVDPLKLIQDKSTTNKLNKLSRFLNSDLLKKKPTISNISIIDLNHNKKQSNHFVYFDCVKSPSSNKKLFEMQKQLGIRLKAKRAAMLTENIVNLPEEEEEEEEIDGDSSSETNSEIISNTEKENEVLQVDEETRDALSDDENIEEEEEEEKQEETENTNPNRPSLKTILTRMESSHEPEQIQPIDPNGEAEWFNSSRPAEITGELELLCSGAFDGENVIPLSQNYTNVQPMNFSPLPPTQIDDEPDVEVRRPKVRQLIDDDETNDIEEEEEEEEEEDEVEDNEELIDYKKQLFEMEAEESGSEIDENDKDNDSEESDEPDEELEKFIDSAAIELDEDEVDNLAKVHLKIKAKEDEQKLKLLKEQYLDFDGDDDGRRIKISKTSMDEDEEDDPDYNSEFEEEEEEDDEEEDNQINVKDRISELERQRSLQDNQAEELHLDEDLDNIGQHSSMFQKGLALKQKKFLNTTTMLQIESSSQTISDLNRKKQTNQTRSVTLSSVLLAKRFSSTLLAPIQKNNLTTNNLNNSNESSITTKKQHNPRRHVFSTNNPNENQNPIQTTTLTGEKRPNSSEKSPKTNIKRFKKSTTITKESSTSVFSALALSNTHRLNNQ